MADFRKTRLRATAGMAGLFSLALMGMEAAPAAAKPPPHAPAHGYRRKTGDYGQDYRNRDRSYDYRRDHRDRYDDRDRDRYDYRDRDRRTRQRRQDTLYSPRGDYDRDGIPNYRDRDIDNDGVRNDRDRYDYRRRQR